jgi:DNA-binding CsgD family transcriptional regulator/PAS domain-containing protein
MDDRSYSELLDLIYETPVSAEAWPAAMAKLNEAFRGHISTLLARNLRAGTLNYAESGAGPAAAADYLRNWDARNSFLQKTSLWRAGAIEADYEIVPKAELVATDIYNGFWRRHDMHAMLRLTIVADGDRRLGMSLIRTKNRGEVDEGDRRMARRVMPHLQRAARLAGRIEDMGLIASAASRLLDLNPVAVVLFDERQRVVFANRKALAMAERGDGFTLRRDRMEAACPSDNEALQALIASAVGSPRRPSQSRGGAMALGRASPAREVVIAAGYIPASAVALFGRKAAAYALVSDPLAAPSPPSSIPQQLFGLTSAESRVAERLMRGESLEEAASALTIKTATARWHLHALFQKTGVSRQSELVRLLMSLPWATGGDPAQPIADDEH